MSRTCRPVRTLGLVAAIAVGGAFLATGISTVGAATSGACTLQANCGGGGGHVATTTTLGTSANPAYAGTDVMFYVQVTASDGTIPSGGVNLSAYGATIAQTTLVNGNASFTVNSLAIGQVTVSAIFSDSTGTYSGSNAGLTEEIDPFPIRVTGTTTLSFSSTQVGGSNGPLFTIITNIGSGAWYWSGLMSTDPAFVLETNVTAEPAPLCSTMFAYPALQPNQSCAVAVDYRPTAAGIGTSTVIVQGTDLNGFAVDVSLTASGTAYLPTPAVTGLSPASGPAAGGTTVTVAGSNFLNVTGITVGGKKATFTCASNTTCAIVTPPGVVGKRTVVVKTPWGTSAKVAADNFKYV